MQHPRRQSVPGPDAVQGLGIAAADARESPDVLRTSYACRWWTFELGEYSIEHCLHAVDYLVMSLTTVTSNVSKFPSFCGQVVAC